jgi:hypothetical protein
VIESFVLDTGCVTDRYADVHVLSGPDGGDHRVLRRWLDAHATEALGLDSETNSEDPFGYKHILRFVQIASVTEVWLLDIQTLGTEFIRSIIRQHRFWVAHFPGSAEIPFIENACPGAFRMDDDFPHVVDTQVVLAYHDPRTVMPEDKEGIDPRLPHRKGLKPTTTRELSPVLEQTDTELAQWFRDHAPVGQRVGNRLTSWGYANVPTTEDVYRRYSALDPLMAIRLWHHMRAAIKARGQWAIVERDLRWQWDIDRMTFRGMRVDSPYAIWLDRTMAQVVADNESALDDHGVKPSGQGPSVGEAFTSLGVAPLKMTKGTAGKNGKPGTPPAPSWDQSVLKQLRARQGDVGELAGLVLASRAAGKFRTTYVEPMIAATERDGLIHWRHLAIGTTTGRNSAMDPPLQQQPKKDTRVRAAYRAPEGFTLVSCDLSQGEPRTMAALSGDANLLEDIYSGDLNGAIATTAFGDLYVPSQGKTAGTASYLMRQGGKAGFLAKCYGGGDGRVLSTLGVDDIAPVRRWESRYSRLFEHAREINLQSAVVLESGRVCPLWDRYVVINGDEPKVYPKPSRKGLNYETQGTQRDLLLACWERLRARGYGRYLWFVLHDEIILCVPEAMAAQARRDLEECMTFTWRGVRFECEAEINGRTWLPQPADFDLAELDSVLA